MFVWLSMQDQERVRNGEKVYEDVGINDVFCLPEPSQKCWLVGEFGYIFWSEDRGRDVESRRDPRLRPHAIRSSSSYNAIEIGPDDKKKLAEFAAQIVDSAHLNVADRAVRERRRRSRTSGSKDDPSALFDVLSGALDEARSVLEDAGVLSDRMRMPNKPPWDYEDFLDDDPTFLDRYLESRKAETPSVKSP